MIKTMDRPACVRKLIFDIHTHVCCTSPRTLYLIFHIDYASCIFIHEANHPYTFRTVQKIFHEIHQSIQNVHYCALSQHSSSFLPTPPASLSHFTLLPLLTLLTITHSNPLYCVPRTNLSTQHPNLTILVADDGEFPSWTEEDDSPYVKYFRMPYDSGLSAGRNLMLSQVCVSFLTTLATLCFMTHFLFVLLSRIASHLLTLWDKAFYESICRPPPLFLYPAYRVPSLSPLLISFYSINRFKRHTYFCWTMIFFGMSQYCMISYT